MTAQTLQDLILVSPIIAMALIGIIPLLIKVFRGNEEPNPFATLIYGLMALTVAAGLTVSLSGVKKSGFSNAIVLDGVSIWASYLVYMITGASLMLAYDNIATRGRQFTEFLFLTLSSAIGMIVLIMANDLMVTFIGIETMSLALYLMIAMSKEEILSKEASFKYFILGSFASAILLYGIALIYGTVGSTFFPDISKVVAENITTNRLFLVGAVLVIIGFGFKISLFPMHAWTPDVYQGAPTPVTAFMSTAVKAASFVAFLRLFNTNGFVESERLLTILQWLAVFTMLIGNCAAIMQDNVKRILAYSSVAHSGYLMIGLISAGFGSNFAAGATGLLFYLFSYSLMTMGTFALVCAFEKSENTALSIRDLRGLAKRHPVIALSLSVLLLSLAGIPPTVGFFAKFFIFAAAMEQDLYWLVLWGVFNSVVSVFYYLRPIVMMYMSEEEPLEMVAASLMTRITVVTAAAAIVLLGLFSSPLLKVVQRSVSNLL